MPEQTALSAGSYRNEDKIYVAFLGKSENNLSEKPQ